MSRCCSLGYKRINDATCHAGLFRGACEMVRVEGNEGTARQFNAVSSRTASQGDQFVLHTSEGLAAHGF